MKKIVLTTGIVLSYLISSAQVIFFVQAPLAHIGNYTFTYAVPPNWGCPDLTIPANSITDTLVFVDDGSSEDSLGCNALINGVDVNGQIAVIYRGNCEFGTKALNAQTAGARGVVIINNVPGAPVAMGAGLNGASVTIPVVMISNADGALLRNEIFAGDVTVFIGSKTGFYPHDLGFYPIDIVRAPATGNVKLVSQNASEFSVDPAAWVFNFGSATQTNVALTAEIILGTDTVYSEVQTADSIQVGDTAFFSFTPFTQSSYTNGYYDFNYSVTADSTDAFPDDNAREADFAVDDSVFAYCRLDETNFHPIATAHYRPSGGTGNFSTCLHYKNPNAGRLGALGMMFSATTLNTTVLTDMLFEVSCYTWDDVFSDLNDPAADMLNVNPIASGEYSFEEDLQNVNVYVPFDVGVALQNDQRYLFCAKAFSADAFLGYDTQLDYEKNIDYYLEAVSPIDNDGSWFMLGFGTDLVPALSVYMIDKIYLDVEELESPINVRAYPNPANDAITVSLPEEIRSANATIYDLSGKLVRSEQLMNNGSGQASVNVSDIARGNYILNLQVDDVEHTIKFVINR